MASVGLIPRAPSPSCLFTFCVIALSLIPASLSSLDQDQQALLQIKSSLAVLPSQLTDWVSSNTSNPCQWSRIACTNVSPSNDTRVTSLDLSSLSIQGELTATSFSSLTALAFLNLSLNSLDGSVPKDIANCTLLTTLDLSSNHFTSAQDLTALSNLQFLSLAGNNLSSTISQALPANCAQLSVLNLSSNSITGDLSSFPWQLCTSLYHLDLSYNQVSGYIPTNLTGLASLEHLVLASNKLIGTIPASLCSSSSSPPLLYLDLSVNQINGSFPSSLTNCTRLQHLDLSTNNISGEVMGPGMGNWASSLEFVNLSENNLTGSVSTEVGSLTNLRVFMAGSNMVTGAIPREITNCKNLSLLDLNTNLLEGNLPGFLNELPSLLYLILHSNALSGTLPASLFEIPKLQFLDLSNNSLSGGLPEQFGNLSSMRFLMVAANHFTGGIPTQLGNLTGLQFLDLSSNHLNGSIPSSLGHLQDLLWLMLAYNNLTGRIPPELGNCTSLLWLNLRSNSLSGGLPLELASMGQDPSKIFSYNAQNMDPPKAVGECLMLKRWIPETYPPYSFINDILDRNRCRSFWIELLTGSPYAPACGQSQKAGGYIQVTDNKLTGSIPSSYFQGNLTATLLLGLNSFTGSLPASLGVLISLMNLNVSHNMLNGSIPDALGDNKCLSLLDLSFNNLSGAIPASLGGLGQLTRFNVSYNPSLTGSIPQTGQFLTFSTSSYINDSLLCFETLPGMSLNFSTSIPFCNSSSITVFDASPSPPSSSLSFQSLLAIGIASCIAIALCGGAGFYAVWNWPVRIESDPSYFEGGKYLDESFSSSTDQPYSTVRLFRGPASDTPDQSSGQPQAQLTHAALMLATNNFDESHVIGRGGFGVVYKATLSDGTTVAIKKLANVGPQGEREFMAEMETLGTIAHKNLVPLLGCCILGWEKLLVYKFLANGSLEDWLHEKEEAAQALSWPMRLRIASGCAEALRYLHHDCYPVLIHRDMKASNVLLDEEFQGYLADFGLARELDPASSHVSTMVAGTLGYVPPEYGQTWRATTKGDVYSFGVVMMELITGRKPLCFSENYYDGCITLVEWVRMLVMQLRAAEAFSLHVVQSANAQGGGEEELLRFLSIACECTHEVPDQRPTMVEVARAMQEMLVSKKQ